MTDILGKLFVFIFTVTIVTAIRGLVILMLWNALVPDIFSLPAITFWQGIGLSVLISAIGMRAGSSPSK